ncbi:dynactin p62 [Trichodelitschia bisporula]|uniref:Dynactin subunit 4 n=1 Tax=Trichodelitschia bisporula TaxID=703511 RepID=A0A6G1HVT7_9PEZI|nr:dynactin p62 [Trichodelitschia bisporula]
MATQFPYTYYSCPCINPTDSTLPEQDDTFDPSSPRAAFSLYPLEHLLYCTECHQVRCPRCTAEEVVCWYCPSCLFEVPSSTVRSEGNQCTRSCYNCPQCTAPLAVNPLDPPESTSETLTGPFILTCPYCTWSSLDIDLKFDKPNNITGQLSGSKRPEPSTPVDTPDPDLSRASSPKPDPKTRDEVFTALNAFYKNQITHDVDAPGHAFAEQAFSSPHSISRLLNLYSTGKKLKRQRPKPMSEALTPADGLVLFDPESELDTIKRTAAGGWEGTLGGDKAAINTEARFVDDARPVASLLRTKRAKRCRACRTLLSRPEPKISTTRYKIRVVAGSNVPRVGLRPLGAKARATAVSGLGGLGAEVPSLKPLLPSHFVLTLTNPLFDAVKVTLATARDTTGPVKARVTILCPAFEVGANTDVWDEALARDGGGGSQGGGGVPEAGKVWERGRNWVGVVVEVVPAGDAVRGEVLEIAVFVRVEYEAGGDLDGAGKREVGFCNPIWSSG